MEDVTREEGLDLGNPAGPRHIVYTHQPSCINRFLKLNHSIVYVDVEYENETYGSALIYSKRKRL